MISLLHPSRQRATKSIETTKKWLQRSGCETELIISIDEDDPQKEYYLRYYSHFNQASTKVLINQNRSAVDAINNAAKEATGNIMIVVSDDSDCPDNWCSVIYSATEGKKDFVLKTFDGIQNWIVTMPVLDREYYSRFGYIYHPDYKHMFCDTEFTHVAEALDRIILRNDILFPHMHYSVTKTRADDINEKANATWNDGKRTYIQRFNENFGLPHTVDKWNIKDKFHSQWIKDVIKGRR
jgi:hypothetical protein